MPKCSRNIPDTIHLRMCFSETLMIALANNNVIVYQHRTHQRIGSNGPATR